MANAHRWQVAHTHWRCLESRGTEKWTALLAAVHVEGEPLGARLRLPENIGHVRKLVAHYGVPSGLRSLVWPALVKADSGRSCAQASNSRFYCRLVDKFAAIEPGSSRMKDQITLDLRRT